MSLLLPTMPRSRLLPIVPSLVLTLAPMAAQSPDKADPSGGAAAQPAFVPLIEGGALDAFTQRGGRAGYELVDGVVVGTSVPNTPNSFLCTKREYGDFELEYEFLVDSRLNSGVQIRSQSLPGYRKGRVHGYQVEIDPSPRSWSGGIYDEARRGWLDDLKDENDAREAFRRDDWNHVRVLAVGDSIRTWINGVPAADLVDPMTLQGFIGLQVHGVGKREEPMQVRWRNLKIRDLGRHVWRPVFDGESLDGWAAHGGGTFEVVDGVLRGANTVDEPRHGHLVLDRPLDDFTIRVRYRAVRGNSGLYIRSELREGNIGIAGIQAEIDPEDDAGGLYETGGRAWITKPSPEEVEKHFRRGGAWNTMTVSAHGGRIVVHLNGRKMSELKDDPGRREGVVALQLHGGQDVEVEFERIELLTPADAGR